MGERRQEEPESRKKGTSGESSAERREPQETSELPEEERRGRHDPEDFSPDDFE